MLLARSPTIESSLDKHTTVIPRSAPGYPAPATIMINFR
jgi:hypothetical protein